jgi:uncharacterized protein (DUF427 family)
VRPDSIVVPGPGQESVWDYPRPPRLESAGARIRAELGGVTLADSVRALRVLETAGPPVYYVPPEDCDARYLEPVERTTLCEWKGVARLWTVRVGDALAREAGWSYPDPFEGFEALRDHLAFYPRKRACFVGEERAEPQPGAYYGGWVTRSVVGPFKGEPGSEDW